MGTTNFDQVDVSDGYQVNGESVIDNNGNVVGNRVITVQGDEIDLTSTDNEVDLLEAGSLSADAGGDKLIPIRAYAVITTEIAADSTAPQVQIQDGDDTDTGLTMDNLADGDAADAVRIKEITDGSDMTSVDVTSKGLKAAVTTAAADAGTAAGKCKIIVECLLVK